MPVCALKDKGTVQKPVPTLFGEQHELFDQPRGMPNLFLMASLTIRQRIGPHLRAVLCLLAAFSWREQHLIDGRSMFSYDLLACRQFPIAAFTSPALWISNCTAT